MLHLSILGFQTLDRIIFGTLTFPEARWYVLTVRDRGQRSLETINGRRSEKFGNHCLTQCQLVV